MEFFEAKQKPSELVERAHSGEEIGITRHGKPVAKLTPAQPPKTWKEFFRDLDEYRKTAPLLKDAPFEEWIDEGHK